MSAASLGIPGATVGCQVAKGQAFDRMALMRSDPSITTLAIGKAMGISDRAVRKRITKMREAGFLLRTGGRKGGHWEVLK